MSPRTPRTTRRRHRGLSLVEVLISLAISASLLTAVSAAYTASCKAVDINARFFRASQSARVCLNQLMSEVRQCAVVEVYSNRLNVITNAGQAKTYQYDAANKQLLLTLTDSLGVTTNYVLGRNISALSFTGDGTSVAMSITVAVGDNTIPLSGSATPRRTIVYR